MENMTVVIPFWNGDKTIQRLLASLPDNERIIVVVDAGSTSLPRSLPGSPKALHLDKRGYFAGAVNAGIAACETDVLVLNQDVWFEGDGWQEMIESNRQRYAIIGDGVMGHPAWPGGYVQGTFMFLRRDAIEAVGAFNARDYPLWGATAEWQLRACRLGYSALPMANVPGLKHKQRGGRQYGDAIAKAMRQEPIKRFLFTSTPPAISVIVPCYNYGRFLREAIDSLMAQTFQSFEIIIVDDASTDGSWQVAQSFADSSKAIRAIRNKTNLGTAATINAGVRKSFGRFITVLSADDKYEPERLARMYRASLANPHSVICDDIIWWTDRGSARKYMGWRDDKTKERRYDFDTLLERNHMHAGIMYPRRAWLEAGGYPEIMRDGREDWAFNIALGRAGYCGVLIDYAGYVVRRQGQNRTLRNTTPEHHKAFLQKLQHLFPDVYKGEYPMACCGRRGRAPKKRVSTPSSPAAAPSGSGMLLQYTGRNAGNQTWYGAETGRRYKFGRNPSRMMGFVDPKDAKQLLATRQFVVAKIQPHAAPAPEPEQEPDPEPDIELLFDEPIEPLLDDQAEVLLDDQVPFDDELEQGPMALGEIDATDSARKYAEEHSIDLSEIGKDGRITYRDVKNYAASIGLA